MRERWREREKLRKINFNKLNPDECWIMNDFSSKRNEYIKTGKKKNIDEGMNEWTDRDKNR